MVTLLYALILIPIACWLVAFGYETWLALERSGNDDRTIGVNYVHASWEITHTLLVYGFTVFLISHADALPVLDSGLFLPVCIFLISLMVRGCLYLYLFSEAEPKQSNMLHNLFSVSCIVSLVAVIVGAFEVALTIHVYNFVPSTDNLGLIAAGFVLTMGVSAVPIVAAYRTK